jgi:N-formylglutamate amidohydrolase
MEPFHVTSPASARVPIVVSVPHCGTIFPDDLKGEFKEKLIRFPDDTDWYVDKLYDFAPSMGITMITAVYSRWIIDLNRDPDSKPLYSDGRIITGLCPVTTFTGEKLYRDERDDLTDDDKTSRLEKYFKPYHDKLASLLDESIKTFGKVLLWDCHSIRQEVPTIHPKKFPDLILGDNDGFAAGAFLTEMASKSLLTGGAYSFENNFLFKGGYITRHYGQPDKHRHALQLEMTKVNYMDDDQVKYHDERAEKMRDQLRRTFEKLVTVLSL